MLWRVNGCDSTGVVGCVIDVWTSSAKTIYIGQATDDGGGNYSLAASAGSRYIEITPPTTRFALRTETFTYTAGVRHTVSVFASSLYVCTGKCKYPIAKTLYYTDAVLGTVTLVYGGPLSQWFGTVSGISTPGLAPYCAAMGGITAQVWIKASDLKINVDCTAVSGFICCPDPAAFSCGSWMTSTPTIVCPEAGTFGLSGTISGTCAGITTPAYQLYSCTPASYTVTE